MDQRVTAVITTHERPPEILERALNSILVQTYPVEEIFIVDDAPQYELHKEVVEFAKKHEDVMTYIVNDKRKGANGSRNIGIEHSKCEFIALLDDDDEWTPDHVEVLMKEFVDDDIGITFGNQEIYENGKFVDYKGQAIFYEGEVYDKLIRYGNFIGGCSIPMMRKQAIVDAGMFDEDMPACQDIDLWIRIAKHYKVKKTQNIVVHYYVSKDAITSFPGRRIKGWKNILRKYSESFDQIPGAKERIVNNMVIVSCTYGKFSDALEIYSQYYSAVEKVKNLKSMIKGIVKWGLLKARMINR